MKLQKGDHHFSHRKQITFFLQLFLADDTINEEIKVNHMQTLKSVFHSLTLSLKNKCGLSIKEIE